MKREDVLKLYADEVEEIKNAGLLKGESPITSPQGAKVVLQDGREVINMCANNYLGLANDQRVIEAAVRSYLRNAGCAQEIRRNDQQIFRYGRHDLVFFLL